MGKKYYTNRTSGTSLVYYLYFTCIGCHTSDNSEMLFNFKSLVLFTDRLPQVFENIMKQNKTILLLQ